MKNIVKDNENAAKTLGGRLPNNTYMEVMSICGRCSICADTFETYPGSNEILCPSCKKTILWVKENKNYLDKLVSELKDKSE